MIALSVATPAHADVDGGRAGDRKVAAKVEAEVAHGGKTTFWVLLRGAPDFRAAGKVRTKAAKAAAVYQAARTAADRDQAGLRTLLTARKAHFDTYWIADTMRVTGDASLVAAVAARPEVKEVLPDEPVTLPRETTGTAHTQTAGNEWNIDRIGAPRVWSERGDTGAGIVVANLDTGVQFDHPALAAAYRGRNADGTITDDYNWYDPSHTCPGNDPCDNAGHGTHTMGTMVGAGGIGVAPGAKWIAAKGCESNSCSTASLLAAGQWIVAPTDHNGANPRPDLAPDVVNNSWGGASGFDPWYSDIVGAWVAAGIFPAFSNGNSGPSCATANTPGSYAATYSSGAFDVTNTIAPFSSRGGGENGAVKPNIAAPGEDVRSSVPGNDYAIYSGTSMASPHTAATVALIWAAAPALRHDIADTRDILDETATDVDDTSCGGTAADNNVWGEGRLDAYAAVNLAVSPAGSLAGTVTSAGVPLAGATVRITGASTRSATTGVDGTYRFGRLVAGAYHVLVTAFGYRAFDGDAQVTNGGAATLDASLSTGSSAEVTGHVTAGGAAVPGATVTLDGTPVSVRTDASGGYRIAAPLGTYTLRVQPVGNCVQAGSRSLTLSGDTTVDVALGSTSDHFGYPCASVTGAYRAGDTKLDLTGDDAYTQVTLPFAFGLYGTARTGAWISTNGVIGFGDASTSWSNTDLPDAATPNDVLYPFWDDLVVDDQSGVYTSAGSDTYVVEWRNVRFFADSAQRVSISATLRADGTVTYGYQGLQGLLATGTSATIGLENPDGTDGLAYAATTAAVSEGSGVTFRPPVNRIAATFNVTASTVVGQNVFVAGSIPELGNWDPARAVALSAAGYPVWSGHVGLPPNTAIQYKYLIKNADGSVSWEAGSNRATTTPPTGQYITHDTFGDH